MRRLNLTSVASRLLLIMMAMLISVFALPKPANSQPAAKFPPLVIDVWPMPGTEMLDLDPLSITFDQPMDKPSTEAALKFDPPLQGVFNWVDAQTLAFTPHDGWPRETTYTVTVTTGTQSLGGDVIEEPYTFKVQTLGMLAVGQVIPTRDATEVELTTPIVVSFNRAMRSLGGEAAPLEITVEPAVTGKGEWVSDTIYQFTPNRALTINTTYTVHVDPVTSADGAHLKEAYTWQFTTLPPKVVQVSIFPITDEDNKPGLDYYGNPIVDLDHVAVNKDIEIQFTDQVDRASVEASFSLVEAEQPVDGRFYWNWNGKVMVMRFDPKNLLKLDTLYRVTVTASARASGAAQETPTTFDFHTVPYPAILSVTPADGATNVLAPNNRPTIQFNTTRIDLKSLESHLVVTPKPDRKPEVVNAYSQYATLDFDILPNTTYTITITAGVKDTFGNTIDTPYTFSYTTGEEVVTIQSGGYDAPTDWRFTVPLNADLMITSAKRAPTTFAVNFYQPLTLPIQLYRATPAEISTATLRSHNSLSYGSVAASGYYDNSGRCQPPSFVKPDNQIRQWNESLNEEDGSQEVALSEAKDKPLPLGLYWITMGDKTQACSRQATYDGPVTTEYGPEWQFGLAVVTANITMKRGPQDVFVWVTDLETTAPIANAKVTVYDGGVAIANGTTNQDGVAQLPAWTQEHQQIVIVAEGEGVFAAWHDYWTTGDRHPADPTASDFDYDTTIWLPQPQETQGYLYTDRPIYRPGDTVYFRGVLRDKRDVTYPVSEKKDIYVRAGNMYNENGAPTPFYNVKMTLNDYGSFSGSFTIPEDIQLNNGYVSLWATFSEAMQADLYGYGYFDTASDVAIGFTVAEYRTPEFEVKVKPDQQAAVAGDPISASVQASYYFGGGVSKTQVSWRTYTTWGDFNYTGTGDWQFGYASTYNNQWSAYDDLYPDDVGSNNYGYYYGTNGLLGSTSTDEHGLASINTVAALSDDGSGQTYTRTVIMEATMTDESGLSISGRGSMLVYPSSLFIGARLDGRPQRGQPYTAEFITVNPDSKPRSDRPITITLEGYLWNREAWGNWKNILSATVSPKEDGTAAYTFTDLKPGVYMMTASGKDEKGRESSTKSYFWVSDNSDHQTLNADPMQGITLTSDKVRYAVGETAHILIPVPFEGASKVLITTEREGVETYAIVDANGGILAYDLPITDADAPNVWVVATFITPISTESPYPKFRISKALGIGVMPSKPFLDVQLTPSTKQAKPGETVTFDVLVKDRDGKPVSAEVGLKLVDKAVLALLPPNSTTLRSAFYNSQQYITYTEISIDSLIENLQNLHKILPPGRGGGGGGGGEAPSVRQNYETTPLWSPHVITDANGKAQVSVKLPDNLTTWELDARVISQSAEMQIGQATTEIMTTLPLIIRPVAPRFMIAGDEMQLVAIINNNTDTAQTVNAKLDATGVTLKTAAEQSVSIPANGRVRVTWPVTVDNATGADLTFSAVGDGVSDAAKPALRTGEGDTIPIYQYVAASTVAATSGILRTDGSAAVTIAVPPRLNTGYGELAMSVEPSVAASITDSFNYLRQFPHFCIEQTVSRFLPNLATYQALKKLNLSDADLEKNLTEQMTAAMKKLEDEQKPEGGWGWYPEMQINPLTSAYAALSLIEAKNAGFSVDQAMLDHAVGYVQTLIGTPLGAEDWELNQYAFLLYVMARDGKGDQLTFEKVLALRTRMSYAARAYLLMAYHERFPNDAAIQTLTSDLIGGATITQNGIFWDEPYTDWWNWGSDTKTTALALTALIRTMPQSELLPDIVRWLMAARRGDHWPTTQETVWSINALSEWMTQTGELQGNYDFAVSLNQSPLLRGMVTPDTVRDEQSLRVEVKDLLQSNRLVITRGEGDGALYYNAYVKLYGSAKDAQPISQGITVTREYFNEKRNKVITSATVGDVINVRLTINVKQDVLYFALEDSIPAGTEPVDKSLLTSSIGAGNTSDYNHYRGWYWDWWYFQQRELRDNGLRLYADYLPAGTYVYTYQIQASLPGEYQVIPTQAYTFYVTDIFGATAGSMFEVLPPEAK